MKIRRSLLPAAFLLTTFPLANCECGDDLRAVAPKLIVADPYSEEVEYCTVNDLNNYDECAYDFGEVAIGEGRFLKFFIQNPSPVALTISKLFITSADPDPAFTLADVRTVKEPPTAEFVKAELIDAENTLKVLPDDDIKENAEGAYTEITVRFTPRFETEVSAVLHIVSDAVNIKDGVPEEEAGTSSVELEFNLKGSGIDLGRPQIRVEPPECNFGQVGVGVAAFCELTIANDGTRDLAIDTFRFSTDTPLALGPDGQTFDTTVSGFGSQTIVFVPLYVAPGTATSVRLFANPSTTDVMTGALELHCNDPIDSDVVVPLSVTGAEAPTAVPEVKSINNVPNTNPSPLVKPLDDVELTGVNSVPATVGATITGYQWEFVAEATNGGRPTGSSVELSTPNAETTRFQFNSSGVNRAGLDVAGTYVIRLTVTDSNGAVSSNDARVTLNAIPSESLHIQLTWDSPNYDYDLHVIKDGGPYCSPNSCFYANCNTNSAFTTQPEWDGVAGETGGDPTLDIDDLSGYGPENINIDYPVDATYRVAVHSYSASVTTETWATLKIYINGALAFEDARDMSNGKAFWEVGEIDWSNGAAIIYPIDTYQQSGWSCPGGF